MSKLGEATLSKVPQVTLIFWIIKIAATTLGETGGDSVTMTLHWGYLAAALPFGVCSVSRVTNCREKISPGPLLGDNRRVDHVRHDDG